jgi:hypothetical protein
MHLPFTYHVRNLDAGQDDARAAKILEADHPSDDPLDGAVILLDHVVQLFVLPDFDRCWSPGVERFEGGQIGAALVHRDRFRLAVLINRFLEVAVRCGPVAPRAAGNRPRCPPCRRRGTKISIRP